MACLIMTRVSKISPSILASRLFRTAGLTNTIPFGVTGRQNGAHVPSHLN